MPTHPVQLTAIPSNSNTTWTTNPFFPSNYSGNLYTQTFGISPGSENGFPDTPPTALVLSSDDDNGCDFSSGAVTVFSTNSVTVAVTVGNSSSLGTGLNLTILLDYSTGDSE